MPKERNAERDVDERPARRRHRELERQQLRFDSMSDAQRAVHEVEQYENRIALLTSLHEHACTPIDWRRVAAADAPREPKRTTRHEDEARRALETYAPGLVDRLLGRAAGLRRSFEQDVETARRTDAWAHDEAMRRYQEEMAAWRERVELATRVLANDETAFREVLGEVDPFRELVELGADVSVDTAGGIVLALRESRVVPSDVKSLTTDERLSVRPMSRELAAKILSDYASSAVLRIVSEVFAAIPVDRVSTTAVDDADRAVLQASIDRESFAARNPTFAAAEQLASLDGAGGR